MFLLSGVNVSAQIVNIPDANFKAKLLEADSNNHIALDINGQSIKIDINYDNEIQESEAASVYYLYVESSGVQKIQSLTGIENFTKLVHLSCSFNLLTSIDVSSNVNLKSLYCNSNQLTSLDISQNILLEELYCIGNQLTSLDLRNNINLTAINCGRNQLTTLDLNNNTNLSMLFCHGNQLTDLNMENNPYLSSLQCDSNQLTSLNLMNCESLNSLSCGENKLEEIDAGNSPNLTILRCPNNPELKMINIKNGNKDQTPFLYIDHGSQSSLQFICTEQNAINEIQQFVNSMGYTNCHVGSYCNFTPGGRFYTVQGNIKFDINNDGCDISEINYPNLNFSISDGTTSRTFIADQSGNYLIPIQGSQHTFVPILENPAYFNVSPNSVTVDFPSEESPFTQNFCVTANGIHSDVEVIITPLIPARPGFDATYLLAFRNKGNQVENGVVSLTFDETVINFVSASLPANNQTNNSFTWNFTDLAPFESQTVEVVFNVNGPMEVPAVNIDDILNFTANIAIDNADETLDDNTFELNQIVVGAYDPNDKTCLQGEIISPGHVGEYIHYLIRFENTGNYPAENIVVKDEIDLTKFDITTLVPLRGSHSFYTRVKDNIVEFIFENINLDFNDETNDGYVVFKIKTKPDLTIGQSFSNYADIYFDYNFPITTNTYVTQIQLLGLEKYEFENGLLIYPNPATDILTIRSQNDAVIQSVEVYNVSGQQVLDGKNNMILDVSDLQTGTYIIKIQTDKRSINSMFVKQ